MPKLAKLFFFSLLTLSGLQARAEIVANLLGTYITDDFSQTSTVSDSKQILGFSMLASLDSKDRFFFGWSYTTVSAASSTSTTNDTFSSADTGPIFTYYMGRERQFNLSAGYNVVAKASFEQKGQTAKEWQGTSYFASLGADFEIAKSLHLGGQLMYYATSYSDQKVGSAASSVSVGRSWVLPVLTLTYRK